jgi:hypothetical protein
MAFFECGFAGTNADKIRMIADLDGGWRKLHTGWGFFAEDDLDYKEESKFNCRLYLLGKAPSSFESRKSFHERYLDPFMFGNCLVSLHGMKLEVDVPLAQRWTPTNDSNRRPSIYEIVEDVFYTKTEEGKIYYRLQIWVVLHGQSKMFVPDHYERGDGFAWIGGRPESNPRKF